MVYKVNMEVIVYLSYDLYLIYPLTDLPFIPLLTFTQLLCTSLDVKDGAADSLGRSVPQSQTSTRELEKVLVDVQWWIMIVNDD